MGTLDIFLSPKEQLEKARKRNKEREGLWAFTDADFSALDQDPEWPKEPLSALILEVSLDTVEKTYDEALFWLAQENPNFLVSKDAGSDRLWHGKERPVEIRLLPGIVHTRSLRWVKVNFASNRGQSPSSSRSAETAPHASLLWAAGYFPKWLASMDGDKVPYVWNSGYQLSYYYYWQQWAFCPDIGVRYQACKTGECRLGLRTLVSRDNLPQWSVPEYC